MPTICLASHLLAASLASTPAVATAAPAPGRVHAAADAEPTLVELALAPTLRLGDAEQAASSSVSLSLLGSNALRVSGLDLGLLASSVEQRLAGLQVGGLVSMAGGEVFGLQLGGLGNLDRGRVVGLQVGGLANVVGGRFTGLQLAGLGNLQADDLSGLQLAGLANVQGGDLRGLQLAGLGNLQGGDLRGLQLAGLLNLHDGELHGLQIATLLNRGGQLLRGAQIALINVGATVGGAQLGLINVAEQVDGLQVGLVNIARQMDGLPLGVVNIADDGVFDLALWSDDVSVANVGLRQGSRWFHTLVRAGLQPRFLSRGRRAPPLPPGAGPGGIHPASRRLKRGEASFASEPRLHGGAGLGLRLGHQGSLYADLDATAGTLYQPSRGWTPNLHGQLRSSLGWRVSERVALCGGVSLNQLLSAEAPGDALSLVPAEARWTWTPGPAVAVWPGAHVGVQL